MVANIIAWVYGPLSLSWELFEGRDCAFVYYNSSSLLSISYELGRISMG